MVGAIHALKTGNPQSITHKLITYRLDSDGVVHEIRRDEQAEQEPHDVGARESPENEKQTQINM